MKTEMRLRSWYHSTFSFELRNLIYRQTKLKHYKSARHTEPGDAILKSYDQHQCVFIHIPKTGGISIKNSLFGYSPLPHLVAQDYRLIFGPETYDRYFKFAFVRNPWDRLYSGFNFLKGGGCTRKDQLWADLNLSAYHTFEHFVMEWLNPRNVYTHIHFVPQFEFVCDSNQSIMIDFVARFETISQDFEAIQARLGITSELQILNQSRKSVEKRYCEHYTPAMREKVVAVYHRDIELFDYSFE
jgi:Sulfotransferase family